MKETVTDPLLFFLASILFGVCLQAIYDIIRGIRRVFYHKSVFLFIEDIGFGIFTAVMAFIFLCTYNDGELRGFFFLGIVIGMILYYQLCSKFLLRAVIHITEKLKKIIRQFEKVCLRPGIHIKRNLKWQLKKEKKQVTIRKKQNKLDQRTKIIMIIVLIFVVILAFSYINLRQKSKKIAKEQQQVESQLLASYESLYRLAYTYVKNPDDAMDVVQESAFKAISRSADVRSPAAIRGWLCRIVVNTAMDVLRARSRQADAEHIPETGQEDVYQDADLMQALDLLDERERTVIVLRFFQELKLQEIAQVTGENVNTVKTILYRSLKKLKLELSEGGPIRESRPSRSSETGI